MSRWGDTAMSRNWPRSSRSGRKANRKGDRIMINCEGFQFVKESRWSAVEKGSFQGKAFLFPLRCVPAACGGPRIRKIEECPSGAVPVGVIISTALRVASTHPVGAPNVGITRQPPRYKLQRAHQGGGQGQESLRLAASRAWLALPCR